MIRYLYKFLSVSILLSGLYGCHANNADGSDTGKNLEDTLATAHITLPDDGSDPDDTSGVSNEQANLAEENFNSISDIYKKSRKRASVFVINTTRDTVIKCKEGTFISIPANSFERTKDQSAFDGNIKLSVKEYYSVSDMLLANLTTSSNGNMIETGGMFFISANAKGTNDSLMLKKGKDITIALPGSGLENMEGMQLFNGVHDSGAVNWEPKKGITGLAERWRAGRRDLSFGPGFNNSLIFPDLAPKKTPTLTHHSAQSFTVELLMPLREVIQNNNGVIKSAIGYIDTAGILHSYVEGNKRSRLEFKTDYTPTVSEGMNVNVAVSFKVRMAPKHTVNLKYFDKLFKMGKGNPDSLVAVTATFLPAIKRINYDKIQKVWHHAITVSVYKNRLIEFKKRQLAYEKHVKLLETNPVSNINTAQEYLILNTQKLGWINCDRFKNSAAQTDYMVKLNDKTHLLIVFNDIKSILSSDSKGIFRNVPLGAKITIVALKAEQGKIMLAMQETVITEKPFDDLQFKPVSLKEYKSKLQKLNSI